LLSTLKEFNQTVGGKLPGDEHQRDFERDR
jgi:hypothetical protein